MNDINRNYANMIMEASTVLLFVLIDLSYKMMNGKLLTVVPLIIMLLIHISQGRKITITHANLGFLVYIGAFLLYAFMSMFWAEIPNKTITVLKAMIVILLQMTILAVCYYKDSSVVSILRVIMYGGYMVMLYVIFKFGWSEMLELLSDNTRLDVEVINANVLGMAVASAIVINIHFLIHEGIKIRDLLIIPAVVVIAASGSRKAIVIVAAGSLMVVMLKYLRAGNIVNNFLKGIFALAVSVGTIVSVYTLSIFEVLRHRMDALVSVINASDAEKVKSNIRFRYNQIGAELFKDHPVLGIGIHNAYNYIGKYRGHSYLHNNFIELLACGGVIGFLIHYSIYIFLFYRMWRMRKQRTKEYDICLVLLVIRLIMGYGYVQYYDGDTYLLLFMCLLLVTGQRNEDTELKITGEGIEEIQ